MSRKTPYLLDVPKMAPSKKERLKQFCAENGIETHNGNLGLPWMAAHMLSARKFGYGVTEKSDLFDCVSKVGRLMDESGITAYGKTEREAVTRLCDGLGILWFGL